MGGNHNSTNNFCDAQCTERVSWAVLAALPTGVIAVVTILRWPRELRELFTNDDPVNNAPRWRGPGVE
ncbi:hypothetical protein FHX37_0650 [Haloactinospora alba]|uniref:Uncharacterized protein n=1 Tax=Haloactinospora alba TaxID=405555 RepID=A0A543NFZ9_9ACTN|nr:hypothetical protein [Haloactinospora alba]TQN30766.1 hypothetical protein FHX37_0650 [Haloactinospora alba]